MSKSYAEKFKDPRWQKKRLKIMERDNWKCCECGVNIKMIEGAYCRNVNLILGNKSFSDYWGPLI